MRRHSNKATFATVEQASGLSSEMIQPSLFDSLSPTGGEGQGEGSSSVTTSVIIPIAHLVAEPGDQAGHASPLSSPVEGNEPAGSSREQAQREETDHGNSVVVPIATLSPTGAELHGESVHQDATSVLVPIPHPANEPAAKPKKQSHMAAVLAARPEKVKRAKKLIADPSYPPAEILKALAETLAHHIRR